MANRRLNAQITIGGSITGGLKAAMGDTVKMMKGIGKQITDLSRREKELGNSVKTFARMGQGVENLRREYVQTIQAVERLRVAQKRLADASKKHDDLKERAGKIRSAGMGASVAGGVLIASAVPGVKEAKHYETEKARIAALGMGEKTNKEAFEFAKSMKTFGTSQLTNLELLRDGMSVFADLHHAEMVAPMLAKMKFGNKAMFGAEKGEDNSRQFMDMLKVIETRGGLTSQAEFSKQANIIQQVISATGGRVTATEWRNLISTGGIAAKGMKDEALYYVMEHLVQEQGGDKVGTGLSALYSSLYQGRTTKRAAVNLEKMGLIADKSKVVPDKAGQMKFMDPGALAGFKTLRDNPFKWMEEVMLPALAKKGITSKDQIIDTIGSMVSNRKGADILAAMYMQREQIHKSEKLNRGAYNIDQLDAIGRNNASGKELEAEAKLADLKLQLGKEILPLYSRGLELATTALKALNKISEEHPALMNAVVVGVTALGAALVVAGPLLVAAGGALSIFASIRLAGTIASLGGLSTAAASVATTSGAATTGLLGFLGKLAAVGALSSVALGVAKAAGLPDVDEAQGRKDVKNGDWLKASAHLSAGDFIGAVYDKATGKKPPASTGGASGDWGDRPLPEVSPAQAGTTINDHSKTEITITQQPGQDTKALADEVARRLKQQQGVRERSSMSDRAF